MASGLRAISGEPVIDEKNGEVTMHTLLRVDIALGERLLESPGTLYITPKRVVWVNDVTSQGYAVDFSSISLNALSTDSEPYDVPCIHTQIETEGDDDNSDSDVQDLSSIREMWLIPDDPTRLDTLRPLFHMFSKGTKLNPDTNHGNCVILFKADEGGNKQADEGGNKQELKKMGVEITVNILQGTNGTSVTEGSWNSREVAIKSVPRNNDNHTVTEMKLYKELDNEGGGRIVRLLYTAVTKSHNNLILEKGTCTLRDLVYAGLYGETSHRNKTREEFLKTVSERYRLWGTDPDPNRNLSQVTASQMLIPSDNLFLILKDIIKAVQFLQKKNVTHGNINPNNILIFKEVFGNFTQLRAKLAMAQTKDARPGWRAPNFRDAKEKGKSDLFTLGLVICFTLTGFHPFGELSDLSKCQNNILNGWLQIPERLVSPEFVHLISSLTKIKAAERADPNHLLGHPAFWTRTKNALFLSTIHGLMEILSEKQFKKFNKLKSCIFSEKGKRKMPSRLLLRYTQKSQEHYTKKNLSYVENESYLYDPFHDVAMYLRLVRNVFQHLIEYKDILSNSLEEAYEQLVVCIAPLLLIETYKFFQEFVNKEPVLREYYYDFQ